MKKLFALSLALVMTLSLAACGGKKTEAPAGFDRYSAHYGLQAAAPPGRGPGDDGLLYSNVRHSGGGLDGDGDAGAQQQTFDGVGSHALEQPLQLAAGHFFLTFGHDRHAI